MNTRKNVDDSDLSDGDFSSQPCRQLCAGYYHASDLHSHKRNRMLTDRGFQGIGAATSLE